MKKYFMSLFITLALLLQSCKVDSEIVYHKDAATSTTINLDATDILNFINEMTPDSLEDKGKHPFEGMEKLPREWMSVYDLKKQEGGELPTHPDSIRLQRKTLMKSYLIDGKMAGFSMKLDHFTKNDYETLALEKGKKTQAISSNTKGFINWDGKTLIINTEEFNLDEFKSVMKEDDAEGVSEESLKAFLELMDFSMNFTLKFDNKIQKIKGKHDWIQQLNDHEIQVKFDSKQMLNKNQILKNKDKKITITTS